jgi:hypothetical protein
MCELSVAVMITPSGSTGKNKNAPTWKNRQGHLKLWEPLLQLIVRLAQREPPFVARTYISRRIGE